MLFTSSFRTVFSCLILNSLFSQTIFSQVVPGEFSAATTSTSAHRPAPHSMRTTNLASLIKAEHAENVYRHLIELHWTPKTGLFRSFPDSNDLKLSQQASTYEQAAMGILALRFG